MMSSSKLDPMKPGIVVPIGKTLVNPRWRNTPELETPLLREDFILHDALGFVDFMPSNDRLVVCFTDLDLRCNMSQCSRRMAMLRKINYAFHCVIAMRSPACMEVLTEFQIVCVSLNVHCVVIDFLEQLVDVLAGLTTLYTKHNWAPPYPDRLNAQLKEDETKRQKSLQILVKIPTVGFTKAHRLLHEMGDLQTIFAAPERELVNLIGVKSTRALKDYIGDYPVVRETLDKSSRFST